MERLTVGPSRMPRALLCESPWVPPVCSLSIPNKHPPLFNGRLRRPFPTSASIGWTPLSRGSDKETHISKYDPDVLFDEVLSRHLQVYEPEFLLWHDPLILGEVSGRELLELAKKEDESLTLRFTNPVLNLLLALRVFKPGYLRVTNVPASTTMIARVSKKSRSIISSACGADDCVASGLVFCSLSFGA